MKILITDDDEMIRMILVDGFEGHTIIEAGSAEDALEKFKSEKPDAVVTDCDMGGRDGLWLTKEIRKINADVPVYMFSGGNDHLEKVFRELAGGTGFFSKPDWELLVQTVSNA